MITKKDLQKLLNEIATATGAATSEEQAKQMGKDFFLYLEYASVYGGYRVVNIRLENHAHYGALGGNGCEKRLSAKEMYAKLTNILTGLEMAQSLNSKN